MPSPHDQTHQAAIDHYHSLMAANPEGALEQLEMLVHMQRERRVLFDNRPLANCLRPTFLTEELYNRAQETLYLIRQALLEVAAVHLNNVQVQRDELGLEAWEIELAAIPTNIIRLSALSRMDSFLTDDSFRFVELNAENPAGIAYIHELGSIYRELPIFDRFIRRFPVRFVSPMEHTLAAMLYTYHEEFDGREERPSIAIVDHLDVPTVCEFELLKGYFERLGFASEICDPREVDCQDGWIYANGRRIDILYRRLLLNEFYEIKDDCAAFIAGYRAQKTCYLNSFRTKLVHKKALFALLTDARFTTGLTDEQKQAIARHIPWTRVLRAQKTTFHGLPIDFLEFVRANRRYFVIKPNDEYGGKGVTIGFATEQGEWEQMIERGQDGAHVVQEVVAMRREPFLLHSEERGWHEAAMTIDLAPYLNGPLMGGCLTRVAASNLSNVTAGGHTLPMFILRNTP